MTLRESYLGRNATGIHAETLTRNRQEQSYLGDRRWGGVLMRLHRLEVRRGCAGGSLRPRRLFTTPPTRISVLFCTGVTTGQLPLPPLSYWPPSPDHLGVRRRS